ncbi:hypothetical protein [Streptomyces erythrochromogenes]|uniref:hypothetical protein n=1 Tax=Streptomyces erythrochromogenes TaxID=285574 RepID=UPI0004CDBBD0|nr:hypothetical protein [Streptomyces erythrochromogenes]
MTVHQAYAAALAVDGGHGTVLDQLGAALPPQPAGAGGEDPFGEQDALLLQYRAEVPGQVQVRVAVWDRPAAVSSLAVPPAYSTRAAPSAAAGGSTVSAPTCS